MKCTLCTLEISCAKSEQRWSIIFQDVCTSCEVGVPPLVISVAMLIKLHWVYDNKYASVRVRLCALIQSTHTADHLLKVSKNSHFYFSLCWWPQHGTFHYFTCILVIFGHFSRVRGGCLCWRKYFCRRLWALIKSTHSGDHFLKVSKKNHFYLSLCWCPQHGTFQYFTCILVIFHVFVVAVCVEENTSVDVWGL